MSLLVNWELIWIVFGEKHTLWSIQNQTKYKKSSYTINITGI